MNVSDSANATAVNASLFSDVVEVEHHVILSCNLTRSPSSAELLEAILAGNVSFQAIMFVPVALVVLMVIMFIDLVAFEVKHSVHWRRSCYKMWILGTFPVLSSISVIAVFVPRATLMSSFAFSFYLVITMKKFFWLLLHYYGGKKKMEAALAAEGVVPPNPFPCCFVVCCCRNQPMTVARINKIQMTVYQVIFVYPIGFFIQLLMVLDGIAEESKEGKLALSIVGAVLAVSNFVCVYGFSIMSKTSRYALQKYFIRGKCASVSLVVGINALQRFILRVVQNFGNVPCGFPYPDAQKAHLLHSYLFIYELFFISILAWFSYRKTEQKCEVIIRKTPALNFSNASSTSSVHECVQIQITDIESEANKVSDLRLPSV